jgi:hypothetical protein
MKRPRYYGIEKQLQDNSWFIISFHIFQDTIISCNNIDWIEHKTCIQDVNKSVRRLLTKGFRFVKPR